MECVAAKRKGRGVEKAMTSEQAATEYCEALVLLRYLDPGSHAWELAQQEIVKLGAIIDAQPKLSESQHEEWTAEFSLFAVDHPPTPLPQRSSGGVWFTLLVAVSAWLGAYWLYSRWPGGHRIIWGDALAVSGICLAVAAMLAGIYDYRRMGER